MNPLLTLFYLPPFSSVSPEHIVHALQSVLTDCRYTVEKVILKLEFKSLTWANLCQPLEESNDRLTRIWSVVEHLNAVKNSPSLRDAYEQVLPLLSEYFTWVGQHQELYQAYYSLKESAGFSELSLSQRKSVKNTLRDFKLSGVGLSGDKQKRYGKIVARLSELGSIYNNNVLDATMGWSKLINDHAQLSGVPARILAQSWVMAESKKQQGWLLTLDMPSYLPILTYADNRLLRAEIYRAFTTRASDQGPNAGIWDNSAVIVETLELRHELAQLLGFKTYAHKSLATKMAESPKLVISFLNDLVKLVRPQAERELAQLRAFAKQYYGTEELEPWDIPYYSEKQKEHLFSINDEQLRPYFPEKRVVIGLFKVVQLLYGITIKERYDVDTWHPDVRFFDLFDTAGKLRGSFYLDLYARENKRSGAWMGDCICCLRKSDGTLQKPVAYLTCNFTPPLNNQQSLLTHNEVITLFHEFGHGLHHILTEIDIAGVSGINGVPWDSVELPSQFMENWCWEPQALEFISGHYKNGAPLPREMLDQLLASKNYQAALFILRQLEFGLFDFLIHLKHYHSNSSQILSVLAEVQKSVALVVSPSWCRLPHTFSHIFSGGYAAGYYSYLWAEVLSSDAYSRFEEEGIFNTTTGQSFLNNILSRGGSEEPMVLFKRFRGREPRFDAMLRHYGITE
ncbi:oligopeptidase A [Serratia symbiotica str. 'Cinara cedri']|nr:oligopeptidase A [Serratia symbiotica str. 'Cinara cedri']